MTRIVQVIDAGPGGGYVTLLEDGRWWRCDWRRGGGEDGKGAWVWEEMPQPPVPEVPPEVAARRRDGVVLRPNGLSLVLERGSGWEPGDSDYPVVLRTILDAPGAITVHDWPTLERLLQSEIEAETQLALAGSRPISMREARAMSRGERSGLLRGAEAIRSAAEHVKALPQGVRDGLKEIAKGIEEMAEALKR